MLQKRSRGRQCGCDAVHFRDAKKTGKLWNVVSKQYSTPCLGMSQLFVSLSLSSSHPLRDSKDGGSELCTAGALVYIHRRGSDKREEHQPAWQVLRSSNYTWAAALVCHSVSRILGCCKNKLAKIPKNNTVRCTSSSDHNPATAVALAIKTKRAAHTR